MRSKKRAGSRRAAVVMAAAALAAPGCDPGTQPIDCTLVDVNPYAIIVDPIADATGERLGEGVIALAVSASDTVSFRRLPSGRLAAEATLGTYYVRVRAAGYLDWVATGVTPRPGVCGGFESVELEARLVPLPAAAR